MSFRIYARMVLAHGLGGFAQIYLAFVAVQNSEILDRMLLNPMLTLVAMMLPGFAWRTLCSMWALNGLTIDEKRKTYDDWNFDFPIVFIVLPWFQMHMAAVHLFRLIKRWLRYRWNKLWQDKEREKNNGRKSRAE